MKIIDSIFAEYGILLPQVCPVIGVKINNYKGVYETPKDGTVSGHLVLLDRSEDEPETEKSILALTFRPIKGYRKRKVAYRPIQDARSRSEVHQAHDVSCVRIHKSGRVWVNTLTTELELDILVTSVPDDFVKGYFHHDCMIKRGAYGSYDPVIRAGKIAP